MDLAEAYKKAKPMYSGRLEHTFVVLKDDVEPDQEQPQATGSNSEPVGTKRPGAEMGPGTSKRKAI